MPTGKDIVSFTPAICNHGADLLQARGQELGDGAESLGQVWERAQGCWQHVIQVSLRPSCSGRWYMHPSCALGIHHDSQLWVPHVELTHPGVQWLI